MIQQIEKKNQPWASRTREMRVPYHYTIFPKTCVFPGTLSANPIHT